jgi:DNA polymerase III epsilon subunit-like protein
MFASTQQLSKQTYPILCPMPVKARYALVFDVETTGLLPKVDPVTKSLPTLAYFPHIIQFSWIVYDLATNMIETKRNYYIRLPNNVLVTNEITDLTGITQDMCNAGDDIVVVLAEFIKMYSKCDFAVAHNLQFDATVIMAELTRHSDELLLQHKIVHSDLFSLEYTEKHNIYLYCTMGASKDVCNLWMEYTPRPAAPKPKPVVIENTGSLEIIRIPSLPTPSTSPITVNQDDQPFRPPTPSDDPDMSQQRKSTKVFSFQDPVSPIASTKSTTTTLKPRSFKKFPKLSETHNYLFGFVPENLHNAMMDVLVCLRCFLKLRCGYSMSNRKFELLTKGVLRIA